MTRTVRRRSGKPNSASTTVCLDCVLNGKTNSARESRLIQINEPRSHRPYTWPTIRGRWGVLQEPEPLELRPWEHAPVSGYYLLLGAFGRPTGERAFVERGGLMPPAPRPQRWRLKEEAEADWMHRALP
jgi:hypothetical protein